MIENTYKQVFHHIQQSKTPVSPDELSRVTGRSKVSVHTALKKLLENGDIEKHGESPRAYYSLIKTAEITKIPRLSLEVIKYKTASIFKKYPVIYAGIAEFVAPKEDKMGEGITVIISYHRPFSIIRLAGLEREIKETLGIAVDVVTEEGISAYMLPGMLHNLKILYGSR